MQTPEVTRPAPASHEVPAEREFGVGLDVRGRIEIVEGAIATFAEKGYRDTTRDDVATHLGVTADDIRSQFPSWPGLVLAVIDRWNNKRLRAVQAATRDGGTLAFMRNLVAYNVTDPGLMRLLVAVSNEAIDPAHPAAPYFRERYEVFHELIEAGIRADVERGLAPAGMDASEFADQIIALYEGFQLQSMLRSELDLERAFTRAVKDLTRDW